MDKLSQLKVFRKELIDNYDYPVIDLVLTSKLKGLNKDNYMSYFKNIKITKYKYFNLKKLQNIGYKFI